MKRWAGFGPRALSLTHSSSYTTQSWMPVQHFKINLCIFSFFTFSLKHPNPNRSVNSRILIWSFSNGTPFLKKHIFKWTAITWCRSQQPLGHGRFQWQHHGAGRGPGFASPSSDVGNAHVLGTLQPGDRHHGNGAFQPAWGWRGFQWPCGGGVAVWGINTSRNRECRYEHHRHCSHLSVDSSIRSSRL